ncbi:MAG TPA: hypothetical protein VEA80_15885 [Vitreimonas sp.]|uniref:hypothetical protein n=1 Tax=Vitreimonas sp. TaxID=3069702 RepID=UPI002D5AF692|nr:hypothetical protein [Vitreimonas sp.]HYD88956.1 hypothetical protein [Vitreimonas sp.]
MPAAAKPRPKTPARGPSKKGAARKRAAPAVSLAGALAEAAWSEADAALAQALADLDEAQGAQDDTAREDALDRLAQSLARAARKRGLTRLGQLGAREAYDPKRHELTDAGARAPKTVRVEARGVARGGEVLAKTRAGRLRKAKSS